MFKKALKIIIGLFAVVYLGFCLAVYFFPRYFFYNPSPLKADLSNVDVTVFPASEVHYRSADGTELYGWYVKPGSKQKIIVYFHGNAYNIGAFYHKMVPLVKAGYGAFIGEYRGFGGIEGELRQDNLGADALAAVDYLHSLGYQNKNLIIYGMSLGSYMAVNTVEQLGDSEPFAGLILEVPFDSLLEVVRQRIMPVFPFSWIVKDTYDNKEKITRINIPVLVMGGEADKVVPVERARQLFSAANEPKKLIVYPQAGHSELYDYHNWHDILDWLEQNEKTK